MNGKTKQYMMYGGMVAAGAALAYWWMKKRGGVMPQAQLPQPYGPQPGMAPVQGTYPAQQAAPPPTSGVYIAPTGQEQVFRGTTQEGSLIEPIPEGFEDF